MSTTDHITFDVPNLDDSTTEPNDLRMLAFTLRALAAYAEQKADAMSYRARGMIRMAKIREEQADRTYKGLPEWARW